MYITVLSASGFSLLLNVAHISPNDISLWCHKLYARSSCGRGPDTVYTEPLYVNGRAHVEGFADVELELEDDAPDEAEGVDEAVVVVGADAPAELVDGGIAFMTNSRETLLV